MKNANILISILTFALFFPTSRVKSGAGISYYYKPYIAKFDSGYSIIQNDIRFLNMIVEAKEKGVDSNYFVNVGDKFFVVGQTLTNDDVALISSKIAGFNKTHITKTVDRTDNTFLKSNDCNCPLCVFYCQDTWGRTWYYCGYCNPLLYPSR